MQIEVKGRNLPVTDELRECVSRRFEKVGKQVSDLAVLEVEALRGAQSGQPGQPGGQATAPEGSRCARVRRPATSSTRST